MAFYNRNFFVHSAQEVFTITIVLIQILDMDLDPDDQDFYSNEEGST